MRTELTAIVENLEAAGAEMNKVAERLDHYRTTIKVHELATPDEFAAALDLLFKEAMRLGFRDIAGPIEEARDAATVFQEDLELEREAREVAPVTNADLFYCSLPTLRRA